MRTFFIIDLVGVPKGKVGKVGVARRGRQPPEQMCTTSRRSVDLGSPSAIACLVGIALRRGSERIWSARLEIRRLHGLLSAIITTTLQVEGDSGAFAVGDFWSLTQQAGPLRWPIFFVLGFGLVQVFIKLYELIRDRQLSVDLTAG